MTVGKALCGSIYGVETANQRLRGAVGEAHGIEVAGAVIEGNELLDAMAIGDNREIKTPETVDAVGVQPTASKVLR